MINAKETQKILEEWYSNNVRYWLRQTKEPVDEREVNRRSLEWDLIEIYQFNGNCLHNPFTPNGEELDKQTVLDFFKYRCMDLYGKDWEPHYKKYNLK